jgi:hypothetical protein
VTEAEWDTCTDVKPMVDRLRGKASDRKLRLFAAACCRCLPFGKDERFRHAVAVTEQYADGRVTKAALRRARQAVRAARYELPAGDAEGRGEWGVYWLAEVAATENAYAAVGDEVSRLVNEGILSMPGESRSSICSLLRCVFGPLAFRHVTLDPAVSRWNDGTVRRIAEGIYQDWTFDRLPVLADALLDAGCEDEQLIQHCRRPGPHYRGCWPIDHILDKT